MKLPNDIYIDYNQIFKFENIVGFDQKVSCIINDISFFWNDDYKRMSGARSALCRFNYFDFTFIFDDTGELIHHGEEDVPTGRVVVAYGISKAIVEKRNLSRTRGYLGPTSKAYAHFGNDYDKGHFIANATGGPLEINLFPQKRHINRGWSAEGKKYRQMEKYVAFNPGTFVFSRPIYNDFTERPALLEFGYLTIQGELFSDFFENV